MKVVANGSERSSNRLIPDSTHNDWLSEAELRELTVEKIVERVKALRGFIAERAASAEKARDADPEVWSAIRKTGIFYLMVPKAFGGLEGGLQDFIDVILPIGEVDASLAWVTAFGVMHQWQLTQFPKAAQDELWGKLPYVSSAGSAFPPGKAVKVEGGYRISAHHRYCSGIMHSSWVNSFAICEQEDGTKRMMLTLIPVEDVEVFDTWHIDGMAATGSHDVVYKDVFVPEHRVAMVDSMREGRFDQPRASYRIPFSTFLALVIAVPVVGGLQGELPRFMDRMRAPGPDGKVPDKPMGRAALARAKLDARSAELILRDAAEQAENATELALLTQAERIRIRAQCSYAANLCLNAMRTIADSSSSSVHLLSNPMQRALRDITVISSHATLEIHGSLDEYGRSLLGMEPGWWLS